MGLSGEITKESRVASVAGSSQQPTPNSLLGGHCFSGTGLSTLSSPTPSLSRSFLLFAPAPAPNFAFGSELLGEKFFQDSFLPCAAHALDKLQRVSMYAPEMDAHFDMLCLRACVHGYDSPNAGIFPQCLFFISNNRSSSRQGDE